MYSSDHCDNKATFINLLKFLNNQDTREFYLIVINFATRQLGKRFWKNTSNPNKRGSSKGVTSVTANHCLSNNIHKH